MKSPFLTALEARVLLADGAMGTLLQSRGFDAAPCLDALVLEAPDAIRRAHEDYIAAGADIIETNTFGANRFRLAKHGLEKHVRDINFKAAPSAPPAACSPPSATCAPTRCAPPSASRPRRCSKAAAT